MFLFCLGKEEKEHPTWKVSEETDEEMNIWNLNRRGEQFSKKKQCQKCY